MTTNYRRGADFERRVRDKAIALGAVLVIRAAGSHTPADLVALWPLGYHKPTWLVQCKRDGRLSATDRATLAGIARETGAVAVLARAGHNGRGIEFEFISKTTKPEEKPSVTEQGDPD